MKTMKKSLAIVLSMVMMLSMFSLVGFADSWIWLPTADSETLEEGDFWFDLQSFVTDTGMPQEQVSLVTGYYLSDDWLSMKITTREDALTFSKDEETGTYYFPYIRAHGFVPLPTADSDALADGDYYLDLAAWAESWDLEEEEIVLYAGVPFSINSDATSIFTDFDGFVFITAENDEENFLDFVRQHGAGVSHEHVFTNYVYQNDATCTENGTEIAVCDYEGCNETDTRVAEGTAGHLFTNYVYQNDATCTADGTAMAVCDREGCNATDTRDAEGTATGHTYGAPVWTWTDDYKATATFTCDKGDDTQKPDVTVTSNVELAPTATADGKKVYTATVVFIGETYTDTKEEVLPATGGSETPTEQPTEQPADPAAPSGENLCKWCSQPHEGFFGKLVGFFHSILYFFAHLFGKR